MHYFAWGFLARSAVMIPTIILVSAFAWWLTHKLGVAKTDMEFDARDMRTWPLGFAMSEAMIFGVTFAAMCSALGDGPLTAGISGGAAALVALGVIPTLLPTLRK